jgi:hypothetical protein
MEDVALRPDDAVSDDPVAATFEDLLQHALPAADLDESFADVGLD